MQYAHFMQNEVIKQSLGGTRVGTDGKNGEEKNQVNKG